MRCSAPSRDEAIRFEGPRIELAWQGDHYQLDAQGPLAVHVDHEFMKQKRGLKLLPAAGQVGLQPGPGRLVLLVLFWQNVREDQVVENTDWLAANLKKFGCQYVQIDDGWQGVGRGTARTAIGMSPTSTSFRTA